MFRIHDLLTCAGDYLDQEQVARIRAAHFFAAQAHEGQFRKTGEPYIIHPLAVSLILCEMRLDTTTLIAALLHDVLEDTPRTQKELTEQFGKPVTELVDGVSKISRMQAKSLKIENPEQAQAENFRKMMLAMTKDIRVILIKLADRLHNMRTLETMPTPKRRRIARETEEIYVPIANRLGMNRIRVELEELIFRNLYPLRWKILTQAVSQARGHRKEIVTTVENAITQRLAEHKLTDATLQGREKHLYSLYKKMREQKSKLEDIYDVYAFRILVPKVGQCYLALGIVHNLYKPVPGKFKDYIAIPKANGYQSLHTALVGPHGIPIEIQIRTEEMHKVAEGGIAAHWEYKEQSSSDNKADRRVRQWLQELLELQKNAGDSIEFLENVKVDLFPDEVYVFTPKGHIEELPRGATALDFAYKIHTDIGNRAVSARINHHTIPLNTRLRTGQTIRILTSEEARPSPSWLRFAVTAKARSTIRQYLKTMQDRDAIQLGERLLKKALSAHNLSQKKLKKSALEPVLEEMRLDSRKTLYREIGLGNRMADLIANHLARRHTEEQKNAQRNPQQNLPLEPKQQSPKTRSRWNPLSVFPTMLKRQKPATSKQPLLIEGTEGMVVNFAKCCRPIAGDPIIGHLSTGKGLVIHHQECKNSTIHQNHPEQWVPVGWKPNVQYDLPAEIRLEVDNTRGVLATIAATISEMKSNIDHIAMNDQDGRSSGINLIVRVMDRKHLARIMRALRSMKIVNSIQRIKG